MKKKLLCWPAGAVHQPLLVLASMFSTFALASTAFAQDMGAAASNEFTVDAALAIGAGLAIGIAAAGGSIGQGRAAAAALEGIARNPNASGKIFVPMILGLALIESLVIYALIIAFFLNGKIAA
jgi:F-type H+-transporting ATPase subunit c